MGFFLQFLWDKMSGDIDRSVEQMGVLFRTFVSQALDNAEKREN